MTVLLSAGPENIRAAVGRILDTFLGAGDAAKGIFLKPNIVFPVRPASGEITPPGLVKAVILALRERYGVVDVVIGEGVAAGCDAGENFRVSGYARLARELNVPLVDLHSAERVLVEWKHGRLALPRLALERTYINLPILKASSACVISGALKNQKGLLVPAEKKQFHRLGLHEPVAELNLAIKPALTVMDGSRFFGRNALLAADNCGELDAEACRLFGIAEPEHVLLAREKGVFQPGFEVAGGPLNLSAAPPAAEVYRRYGRLRLWSNPQACTMCRRLFHEIRRAAFDPRNLGMSLKLLAYSMRGAEVLAGSSPDWRKEYPAVICVGQCTRRIAQEGGYIFIPGCPPKREDFERHLP